MSPDTIDTLDTLNIGAPSIDPGLILLWIFNFFRGGGTSITENKIELLNAWNNFYVTFTAISIMVCLLLIVGIAYSIFRVNQIRTYENHEIHAAAEWNKPAEEEGTDRPGSRKWRQVEAHAQSGLPSDWRLAILEADIILDDLVFEKFGYVEGDTLGERLRNIAKDNFKTVDKAFEAHRMRNAIAHQGSDFQISERDANHALNLFNDVFREFDWI